MSNLAKWEHNYLPEGFYEKDDVWLWIELDGKVYKRKRGSKIHAHVWGDEVWGIDERGYYSAGFGLITCHGNMDLSLRRKLARKFKDAIYYRQGYEV